MKYRKQNNNMIQLLVISFYYVLLQHSYNYYADVTIVQSNTNNLVEAYVGVVLQPKRGYQHPSRTTVHDLHQIWSNPIGKDGDENDIIPKKRNSNRIIAKKNTKNGVVKKMNNNKPRSTLKNMYYNTNNKSSSNQVSSSVSLSSSIKGGQPPLLVDVQFNTNQQEQQLRMNDNSIETSCIHYTTCSGCTIGSSITKTNIIQTAKRYFAIERYDGGKQQNSRNNLNKNNQDYYSDTSSSVGVYPVVIPSPIQKWRTQAKLAVSNKSTSTWKNNNNAGCIFGLYEKGSHVVSPIPQCIVHHPSINTAITLLEQATARTGTIAYTNTGVRNDGDLRYVQLQVERITGRVCLTLVYNAASLKECQPSLARLVKELTKSSSSKDDNENNTTNHNIWHSIWCHCNDSVKNNIFSRSPGRWHRLIGPEYMREPIPVEAKHNTTTADSEVEIVTPVSAGWLYFSPLTFRQGNLDGFDILALHVARSVPMNAKVCELYGGVGVLGLTTLAYHYYNSNQPLQWLRCSDENPANVRCFDRSVESLSTDMTQQFKKSNYNTRRGRQYSDFKNDDIEQEFTIGELAQMMESGQTYNDDDNAKRDNKKVSYMIATAAAALKAGQALGANVLIVDPPRKGLEDEVLDELCKPYDPNQPYVESITMLTIPDEQVNWVNDVQTLIYVSCGFDALARDCDRLLSSRLAKWKLQSTTGYVLFPGSDHVETVAIFERG